MACSLTQGFSLDCKDALGGISDICLAPWSTIVATGLSYDITTGEVQDLPSSITLYRYEVDDLQGSWNDGGTAEENGGFVFNPEVTVKLRKIDYAKRKELTLLIQNRLVLFIIPHRGSNFDKKIFVVGLSRGLRVTAGGFEHAAEIGGFSGLNLTFTGQQTEPSRMLEAYTDYPFDNTAFSSLTISPAINQASYPSAITES